MSGYVGLNQRKKQKLEAAVSRGVVQALRMENDAHVVGLDATIANSKMVKPNLATAPSRVGSSRLRVITLKQKTLLEFLESYSSAVTSKYFRDTRPLFRGTSFHLVKPG